MLVLEWWMDMSLKTYPSMIPHLLRSVTFVYNRTYELHFYPVDIFVRVPCVLQDCNIALCVDRRCQTLLVFSLVNGVVYEISHSQSIQRVTNLYKFYQD
jgi:hypothetical protein